MVENLPTRDTKNVSGVKSRSIISQISIELKGKFCEFDLKFFVLLR